MRVLFLILIGVIAMGVRLTWNDNNFGEEGHRVYRSTSTMDPQALPTALVELGPDVTEYEDGSVVDGTTYFYRVSAYNGTTEVVSSEVEITASVSEVPIVGLDLWYKVGDYSGTGTLIPDSAGTFDGSLVGGATVVPGELGTEAIQFDGVDDYVDTGYKTSGGSYTISMWVNASDITNSGALYAEINNTDDSYGALFWIANGNLQFGHFRNVSGNYDVVSAGSYAPYVGTLKHLVAVRDNGVSHKIYIDGLEVATGPAADVPTTPTYIGKIGDNPDYDQNTGPSGRHFTGTIDRDIRIYNRALTATEVQDLYNEHYTAPPFTLDENSIANTECDDITDFNIITGSPTVTGSELTLAANTTDRVELPVVMGNPGGDFLIYFKMKVSAEAGKYSYLYLRTVSDGVLMNFIFNYNFGIPGAELGTVSISMNAGAEKKVLRTGVDTTLYAEYAIHVDRDRNAISAYLRDGDGYTLLNTFSYFAGIMDIENIMVGKGGGSDSNEIVVDYITVAKPNFVSIGDSITAGHNFFDPDPNFYAGIDNVKNSWQGHWNYPSFRNDFMVNKGIGSQDTGEVNARIGEATRHEARYVFLSACNNDYGVPLTQTQRTSNIQANVDAIVNAGQRVVLYNAIYPSSGSSSYPNNSAYYKDWWDNYRSQITGTYQQIDLMVPVVDAGTGYVDPAYVESDGVHPNVAGYTLIGNYFDTEFSHTP